MIFVGNAMRVGVLRYIYVCVRAAYVWVVYKNAMSGDRAVVRTDVCTDGRSFEASNRFGSKTLVIIIGWLSFCSGTVHFGASSRGYAVLDSQTYS